jgi:hypothetical protein
MTRQLFFPLPVRRETVRERVFCTVRRKALKTLSPALSRREREKGARSLHGDFIDEAPAPRFAGLEGADDGVTGFVGVFAGVFAGAGVAAADVAAGAAHAEVDPVAAGGKALFAAVGGWGDVADHVGVVAGARHISSPGKRVPQSSKFIRRNTLEERICGFDRDTVRGLTFAHAIVALCNY